MPPFEGVLELHDETLIRQWDEQADKLAGTHRLSADELFPPEFMSRNSGLPTFTDLLLEADLDPNLSSLDGLSSDESKRFHDVLKTRTTLDSWESFFANACAEWAVRKIRGEQAAASPSANVPPQEPKPAERTWSEWGSSVADGVWDFAKDVSYVGAGVRDMVTHPGSAANQAQREQYLPEVIETGKGYFVNAPASAVQGLAHVATHPLQTVQDVGSALWNYDQTLTAMVDAAIESWQTPEGRGGFLFNTTLAALPAPTLASKLLDNVSEFATARWGRYVDDVATSRAVASTSSNVSRALTQAEQRAVSKINNILKDHLTPKDLQGALRDMVGNPVPKPGGGHWNHVQEVNEAINGLHKHIRTLEELTDPAARAARQRALEAIQAAEEFLKGAGL